MNVPKGKVQALWCGVQIPEDAKIGVYKGNVTLTCEQEESQTIPVEIRVEKDVLADKGDNDLWRYARLRWLNSTIGEDNNPVKPYTAMQLDGKTVTATDKTLLVGDNGLPASIQINEKEVLASPFRFVVVTNKGAIPFEANNVSLKKDADGLVSWTASSTQMVFVLRTRLRWNIWLCTL